jgi:hypothetical protein
MIHVDPVVAISSVELDISDADASWIVAQAAGRPLVIDYRTDSVRGITIGDLTVAFTAEGLRPRYVEIQPVHGVRVLVERNLVDLLGTGAVLRRRSLPWPRSLAIFLAKPELWMTFVEAHPGHH